MVSNLLQDIRYAVRRLAASPGFTAAAIVTIALGIGVNAGVFTILNGALFRDLPVPDAHELVAIYQTVDGPRDYSVTGGGTFSTTEYRVYRERAQTLAEVLAYSNAPSTTLGGDSPQEVPGTLISCNYFAVLRQPPVLGRALSEPDCETGAEPVVVLGHHLWTTTFASDPTVLGRTVELNRQSFAVVGVAAENTHGATPYRMGYFAPISAEPLLRRNGSRYADDSHLWLYMIGRRNDQIGIGQVRAELGVIAAQIDELVPGRSTTLSIERTSPMPRFVQGVAAAAAALLMAAFGFILLIASANVANLLLARGTARSREIGIRFALGASRARVVRQLLTESVLLAIAGGVIGCVFGLWSFQALAALALPTLSPPGVPAVVWDLRPDYRVLVFAVGVTLCTGILFGLAPAFSASKPNLHAVIKQDSAGDGGSRRGGQLRGTLVGVQVALCMTLMIAAGLLVRGLYATYTTDTGFAYEDVAYASVEFESTGYDAAQGASFRQRFKEAVAALPGVDTVAYAMGAPFGDERVNIGIRVPGDGENEFRRAALNVVGAEYFSVIGLPILRGRTFTEEEIANAGIPAATRPVVISVATARNLWPDGDPIGQTLLRPAGQDRVITLRVVGVAADAQVSAIGEIAPYYVYEPTSGGQVLLVKSAIDLDATIAGIRAAARTVDPSLAVRVLPLEANIAYLRGLSGTIATLAAGLGALALALASVGIYGIVSYAVRRRYREMGLRIALGARTRDLFRLLLRQTMRPVVIGAVVGLAAASAVSSVFSSVLFGVSPVDPVGFGGAALLVLGVAFLAGVLAARPATTADPITTLRHE